MKVIWEYLSGRDRAYLLAQIPSKVLVMELSDRVGQPPEDADEENDEEEFQFWSDEERLYAFAQLSQRCTNEDVKLALMDKGEIPLWLQKEILERRKGKWDESKIKVYCLKCGWKGTRKECPYGHDDVICPRCGFQTIKEGVSK